MKKLVMSLLIALPLTTVSVQAFSSSSIQEGSEFYCALTGRSATSGSGSTLIVDGSTESANATLTLEREDLRVHLSAAANFYQLYMYRIQEPTGLGDSVLFQSEGPLRRMMIPNLPGREYDGVYHELLEINCRGTLTPY